MKVTEILEPGAVIAEQIIADARTAAPAVGIETGTMGLR